MGNLISRTVVLKYLQEQHAEIIKEKYSESRTLSYDTIIGMESTTEAFMNFIVQMPDSAYEMPDSAYEMILSICAGLRKVEPSTPEETAYNNALGDVFDFIVENESDYLMPGTVIGGKWVRD